MSKVRRVAYLVITIAVAILTPSVDVISLFVEVLVAVVLFEVGLLGYRSWVKGNSETDDSKEV